MFGGTPSTPTYHYTYTTTPPLVSQAPKARFSTLELEHILIASAVLTLDFSLLYSGVGGANMFGATQHGATLAKALLLVLPTAVMVTLTAFLSHEMAHKFVSRRMGHWSEFRMYPQWLILSIITAFLGFLFAAPGATMVRGVGSKREMGISSMAGPAMNLLWAGVFTGSALIPFHYYGYLYFSAAFYLVGFVNLWFAIFNLIPFGPLDGKKVLAWNHWIWGTAFFGAVALFISFYIL